MVALTYQSPIASGENEADHKARLLEGFAKKEGGKAFAFQRAYEYLKDRPKWTIYVGDNEADKMPKRGKGQKAAKRIESEKKRVDRIIGEYSHDNQPVPIVADANAPLTMMDMFGRATDDFRQMAYHMSMGMMSPKSKASMKAKAAIDLDTAKMEKEKFNIDLENAKMDLRKRKIELDMIEVEAMERRQSAMTRLGVAESTTPTVAVASVPKTNAAISRRYCEDAKNLADSPMLMEGFFFFLGFTS